MRQTRISIRYAKALFELALEQKCLEQTHQDMILIRNVCSENRDLRLMLTSPVINIDKKQKVLKSIFENKVGNLSLLYLNIITAKRREIFLEPIANQFISVFKDYSGILSLTLTTAIKIDDEEKNKIIELTKSFTKKEIELTEEIKSEIIGGFILKFGQYQYDESIRTKMIKLRREFNINIYEKGY